MLGTVVAIGLAATPAFANTVPDAPAQPAVAGSSAGGVGQVIVTFTAPGFDGGDPITGYTALCVSGDGGATNSGVTPDGNVAPITVTPLTSGAHYTCTVTATNLDGTSLPSPSSSSTFAASAPNTPTIPTVTRGNGTVVVTFTQPAPNGSLITNDTATCTDNINSPVSASHAGSPVTVTGLVQGNAYTCHLVATNAVGTSGLSPESTPAVVFASVPSAPAAPIVTRGSGTLVVSFGTPANNGAPITGFAAGCTSTNGGVPGAASGSATPLIVSALTNGKLYTCHVHASNGVGTGTDSAESSPAVAVALTPGAPSTPTLVSGNAQISVAFTPGTTNGDPITTNTAACTSTNGGVPGSASGNSPIAVTALTNAKTYQCTVTSTNGVGTGPASSAGSIVTGLPSAALQPTVTAGDSQIAVNFAPVSGNGSTVTSYTAACISTNGGPLAFGSSATPPVLATTVNNSNGFTYTCHVTATNSVGVGPDSPESGPVTPSTVPDPPNQPTITAGNNNIQVIFTAPASNGSPITSYTATCTSSDGGATGTASGTTSPITVNGLTNSNTYTCNVRATNGQGDSSPSDDSAPAIADAVPSAPAKPTVTPGGARLAVSFNLPADNGDPIFKTTATCTSSNGGVTRSAVTQPQDLGETFSPIAVIGLTNGRTYTCKVTATNDVGTSPLSPASSTAIPRSAPGAPIGVRAVSGNVAGSLGPVNVVFTAGSGNGSPITSFRATCTDLSTGLKVARTGTQSPIAVGGLTTGHTFSCVAFDTGPGGTSLASAAAKVVLGAPGIPVIARVVEKNRAVTLSLLAPASNGKPITRYTALCTSTNGGAKRGSASIGSQLVVSNMSLGASYTCTVTASNARGVGAPARVGPINITK